jgi:hypothetical protein
LKYYLSGSITHQPNFKEYFANYEAELHRKGRVAAKDIFNPAAIDFPQDVKWETCMRFDIKVLMDCDCLVLLPNWRFSRGVKVEIDLCRKLGIRVVKFADLVRELIHNAS